MRKTLGFLLAAMLLFSLTACASNGTSSSSTDATTDTSATQTQDTSASSTADTTNTTGSNSEPQQYQITLYLPNSDASGFTKQDAQTDGTVASIVSLLADAGAIPEGSEVLDSNIDATGVSTINMNAVFGQAVKSSGTTGEYLMLGSLVNTILTYYDLEDITLTVEGSTLETGHATYDTPLQFFGDIQSDIQS